MEEIKLLIIDDDIAAFNELSEFFKKEQVQVLTAADGKAGLSMFSEFCPDVVITDMKLPGIDGLQLLKSMKELRPNIPIILTTAFGDSTVALQAIRLGALDYIKKPVDLNALLVSFGKARERVMALRQDLTFPTVLIAEDEAIARMNLSQLLQDEGFTVFEAENGQVAVDIFARNKIDIALLDIQMPKMDGLTALHTMREKNDDFEALIITAYGDETTAVRALRDGVMNFIKKPIDIDLLLQEINRAKSKIIIERAGRYRSIHNNVV